MQNFIIIIGASSGIGQASAIHFASLGAKLVITGRKEAALQVNWAVIYILRYLHHRLNP